MFKSLGSLIKSPNTKFKKNDAIFALQIRQVAKKSIRTVCSDLPSEVTDSLHIKSVKNGVLTINAPSLVAAELQMRSGGLIEDINRQLGQKILHKIRFKVN